MTAAPASLASIVVAGGRASRFGGVDKVALDVGGTPMLTTVLDAGVAAGCSQIVVVGPERRTLEPAHAHSIVWVADPVVGGGPAAALSAGLTAVGEHAPDVVLVLAADLPFLTGHVLAQLAETLQAAGPEVDGVVAVDDGGRTQWLLSAWRTTALHHRVAAHGAPPGSSVHELLGTLRTIAWRPPVTVNQREPWRDCDTPDDLSAARRRPS